MPANRCAAGFGFGSARTTSALSLNGVSVRATMTSEDRNSPSGAELLGLGVYLAVVVLLPLLIGLAIDSAAHTSPLGLLVGVVVGVAAAAAGLWFRLRRYL